MVGWKCALWSVAGIGQIYPEVFRNFRQIQAHWFDIHFASLGFANVFMVISPFLMLKRSRDARPWNWVFIANFAAFISVWSFFPRWLFADDKGDMKIGYHVWTLSFLLVFLSAIFRQREITQRPILEH